MLFIFQDEQSEVEGTVNRGKAYPTDFCLDCK